VAATAAASISMAAKIIGGGRGSRHQRNDISA